MAHAHAHHIHAHPPPADLGPAFRCAVGLNAAYVLVEAGAGFLTGSLALIADAAHNLTDVAGLLIAWGAAALATRAGNGAFTFGYGRATILAAMLNAIAILVGVVVVVWAAAQRFSEPVEVPGLTILLIALAGIAVNTGSALLFMRSQRDDLNAKGAFLHMAADAIVSGAVVAAAAGIMVTGWQWLDPAVAIAVSLLIAWTAWGLLRHSLRLELDGVPHDIDPKAVADWLAAQKDVRDVHDLHIWALSTTRNALAVHLVWDGKDRDALLDYLADVLRDRFGISHTTVQLEARPCERASLCDYPNTVAGDA